jgi:predicted NBD/HSP70 family sugar kinase
MASSEIHLSAAVAGSRTSSREGVRGLTTGRELRPRNKVLPRDGRWHNRSLVLQTLYSAGGQSRADIARGTGLTRVTVSDLTAALIAEGLVVETGRREEARPGKPATLLDIPRGAFQIIGIDLSEYRLLRGAVLDLDGQILARAEVPLAGSRGDDATAKVIALTHLLVSRATAPILGVGVGSPGIVHSSGVVLGAPNLGWYSVDLQGILTSRLSLPVVVANDANVAALAEHSFGDADSDMMLIKVGHGVGAGLLLAGTLVMGNRFAAGEVGHVVVDAEQGARCICGKFGCLETWLSTPRLEATLAAAIDDDARTQVLSEAGRQLGTVLAPVVAAVNLSEVVLSGPPELLDGPLALATLDTIRTRTRAEFYGGITVRMTERGEDIVVRGAAVLVLSRQLGVS